MSGFAVTAVIIAFALLAVLRFLSDSKAERLLKIKTVVKWSAPAQIGSSRAVERIIGA